MENYLCQEGDGQRRSPFWSIVCIHWTPPSLGIYNSTNEIREGPTLMRLPSLIIKCLLRIVTTIDNG